MAIMADNLVDEEGNKNSIQHKGCTGFLYPPVHVFRPTTMCGGYFLFL